MSAYRPFLKDKHRGRTLVGSKSGTTPRPAILCRGGELGESCRPEELWLAIGGKGRRRGPEGEGQDRAKTGGPLELFSRGRLMESCKPMASRPALRCSRISD